MAGNHTFCISGELAIGDLVASLDHTVIVWDTALWVPVKRFRGHSAEVEHVAWSPSGRRLASGGRDGEILLWEWPPRTNSAEALHFSATHNFNLSGTGDALVRITAETPPMVEAWNLKTLGLVARYPVPGTNLISSWLPPGGEVAVVGDASGRVGIRQLATGREIAGTNGHRSDVYQLIGATAKPLVFAASGHDREGRIWDLRSLTRRGGFEPDMPFDARTMMPDGSLLAIGYTDGRIDLRNLPSGNRQAVWPAHRFPSQARLRCSCRKAIHKAPSHC